MIDELECKHLFDRKDACGGFTVCDHSDAPYSCVLHDSCDHTFRSEYAKSDDVDTSPRAP